MPATPTTSPPTLTTPGSSFAELGIPSTLVSALTARGITARAGGAGVAWPHPGSVSGYGWG